MFENDDDDDSFGSPWDTVNLNNDVEPDEEIETTDDDDTRERQRTGDKASGQTDAEDPEDAEDESEADDQEPESDATDTSRPEVTTETRLAKGRTSADRIAELAAEIKAQRLENQRALENERLERESDRLRAKAETELSLRENVLANNKAALDTEYKGLSSRYKQAREDGDADAELRIIEKMQETKLRLMATDSEIEKIAEDREALEKNPPKAKVQARTQEVNNPGNEKALAWLERNNWVQNAPEHLRNAIANQAELMIASGKFDVNSDAFYDSFGDRVSRLLKDNDIADFKVVHRTGYTNKGDNPKPKSKSPQPSAERAAETNLVASRTKDPKTGKMITTLKPSDDDKEMARRLGLDIKVYMKERLRDERALKAQAKGAKGLGEWQAV
jgi:hypothetical protein